MKQLSAIRVRKSVHPNTVTLYDGRSTSSTDSVDVSISPSRRDMQMCKSFTLSINTNATDFAKIVIRHLEDCGISLKSTVMANGEGMRVAGRSDPMPYHKLPGIFNEHITTEIKGKRIYFARTLKRYDYRRRFNAIKKVYPDAENYTKVNYDLNSPKIRVLQKHIIHVEHNVYGIASENYSVMHVNTIKQLEEEINKRELRSFLKLSQYDDYLDRAMGREWS